MLRPLFFLAILSVPACAPSGPAFSLAADREIGRLKSRTLRVMEAAEFPYTEQQKSVDKLLGDLKTERLRARARPDNEASLGQWDLLLGPDLLGGFLARWEAEGALGSTYILESTELVSRAFDTLRSHERSKAGGRR